MFRSKKMALTDLAVRQAKATDKAYTSLTWMASPWPSRLQWAGPGTSATTGRASRSGCRSTPTRTLRFERPAANAMKRAPCWPKASIPAFTASRSAQLSGSPTKTPSTRCTASAQALRAQPQGRPADNPLDTYSHFRQGCAATLGVVVRICIDTPPTPWSRRSSSDSSP